MAGKVLNRSPVDLPKAGSLRGERFGVAIRRGLNRLGLRAKISPQRHRRAIIVMALLLPVSACSSSCAPTSPTKPETMISACTAITTPGSYAVSAELPTNPGCLTISQVSGVQLDCQNHHVPGVELNHVNNAMVTNCLMTDTLTMTNVSGVTVSHSTTTGGYIITASSVSISTTTIGTAVGGGQVGGYTVTGGTGVTFTQDTIIAGLNGIWFQDGMNNQVIQSTLTGGYDGGSVQRGADDGVVLRNESGDTVQGNTFSNFFDTAVETAGAVTNSTVANNQVANIGTAAFGSYWCTNWSGNQIRGNTVSMAPLLVLIRYEVGTTQCGTSVAAPGFVNNQFLGNVFGTPIVGLGGSGPEARMQVQMPGTVQGNLVQSNNFGTLDGPDLTPLSGFVDGGGNTCGPLNPTISNFVCTGGSVSAKRRSLLARPPHRY